MRYYSIKITKNGQALPAFPVVQGALVSGANFTSFVNGATDFGALNIEIDAPVGSSQLAMSSAWIRIWGIGINQINQAADLNNCDIEVYAGMQAGLPLADPSQSGLILKGQILPAFGNWIGTDMTIDMVVSRAPTTGQPQVDTAKNIVHHWPKQTPLKNALQSTLKTAFPSLTPVINISSKLILNYDDIGFYQTVEQYSQYLNDVTKNIIGGKYPGVSLSVQGDKIYASDQTTAATSKGKISFQDLIGQPTWRAPNTISVKTVMRADLNITDKVTLPQSQQTTTAQASSQYRSNLTFSGEWTIQAMRHVGNFRQPDSASWNTTFEMVSASAGGAS